MDDLAGRCNKALGAINQEKNLSFESTRGHGVLAQRTKERLGRDISALVPTRYVSAHWPELITSLLSREDQGFSPPSADKLRPIILPHHE